MERYRFEYGNFLLNKNIEQLMNAAGITVLDIRTTLPNLKNLIVTLTASNQPSSKLSRRHHIGSELISLQGSNLPSTTLGLGHPSSEPIMERQNESAQAKWSMSLSRWATFNPSWQSHPKQSTPAPITSPDSLPTVRSLGKPL